MLFALEPSSKLVGIARLAEQSSLLASKSQADYFELPTRSVLNRCSNRQMPFQWTINPYRGCEIGCKYCYARYTHEFMGMSDGLLFERKIYSKQEAATILRQELSRHRDGAIAIGTSTDPYQPAERRFGTTRSILEVFTEQQGRSLSITTKSDLVTRDIDLLKKIHEHNELSINVTVTTTDTALARKLEPFAPRPDLRLKAVAFLASADIHVGVFASPIMPLLTDSIANLDAIASEAVRSGARYFGGGTLFLMPSAQEQFFPFLDEHYPSLAERYKTRYGREPYLRGDYEKWIRARVRKIRRAHRLDSRPKALPPKREGGLGGRSNRKQLPLFA